MKDPSKGRKVLVLLFRFLAVQQLEPVGRFARWGGLIYIKPALCTHGHGRDKSVPLNPDNP